MGFELINLIPVIQYVAKFFGLKGNHQLPSKIDYTKPVEEYLTF
jgi:hypothetical protein